MHPAAIAFELENHERPRVFHQWRRMGLWLKSLCTMPVTYCAHSDDCSRGRRRGAQTPVTPSLRIGTIYIFAPMAARIFSSLSMESTYPSPLSLEWMSSPSTSTSNAPEGLRGDNFGFDARTALTAFSTCL